jgi:hypothetical protein
MAGVWFKRVVWIGVLANFALAVPTLVAPEFMIRLVGIPMAAPLLWPQFAALLLILLSIFYIPAANNYARYRATAWTAVFSRLAGVIFFVGFQSREYHMFGYFDLVFFVPELILLTIATRSIAADGVQDSDRARRFANV